MRTNTKVFFIFVALMILQMPGRAGKGQVWRCLQGYGHFEKSPHLFSPPPCLQVFHFHNFQSFHPLTHSVQFIIPEESPVFLPVIPSLYISPIPSISQISRYFPCFRYKRIFWLTPGLTILKGEDSLISCPLTH